MKNICFILFLLIISLNISCLSSKKRTIVNCENENLLYLNYNTVKELNKLKNIPEVKEISEKSFNWYLSEGANFVEVKKDKIIFIPKEEFYEGFNLTGVIPLYVLGYFQNNEIKQYIVAELNTGKNSSLYIINQIDDKIVSMFLCYENFRTGFGGRDLTSKKLSNSIFQSEIYFTSDTKDEKGSFSKRCAAQLKLSNDGSVTANLNVNHSE